MAFLSRIRRETRRLVRSWTSVRQYSIDQVFEEMFARCRELRLRLLALPVWELDLTGLPEGSPRIATGRLKSASAYRERHGITSGEARGARGLPPEMVERIQGICRRVYSILELSGYARIDLRLDENGNVYVLEANPNAELAHGEDFAESAEKAGIPYGPLLQRIVNLGLSWGTARD